MRLHTRNIIANLVTKSRYKIDLVKHFFDCSDVQQRKEGIGPSVSYFGFVILIVQLHLHIFGAHLACGPILGSIYCHL